jgi:hypothetical protein
MIHSLLIDDLTFAVRWGRRRRTIGISVGAGGELRAAGGGWLSAGGPRGRRPRQAYLGPEEARRAEVRAAEQIRAYEAGELFPYRGRRCPLRLVDDPELAVQMQGGRFELDRGLVHDGRAQMARLQSPTVALMEKGTLRCDEVDEPIRSCDGRR